MVNVFTRRQLILIIAISFLAINAPAQINEPGIPASFSIRFKTTENIPLNILQKIDTLSLLEEDHQFPSPYRYGICIPVTIDIIKEGLQSDIPGTGKIWRYQVHSKNAYSLGLFFQKFKIPENAKLYLYDQNRRMIAGAYTGVNNNLQEALQIAEFSGDNVIIEYFEPYDPEFHGELILGRISHAYKEVVKHLNSSNDVLMQYLMPVNCEEALEYKDIKHSVCKITFNDSRYSYMCSGALINNSKSDKKPYVLTAFHCLHTNALAQTIVAYFNYEQVDCAGLVNEPLTSSGAKVVSSNLASDFSLLLMNAYIPRTYQPFFAGWDASGNPAPTSFLIHHPNGGPKKISFSNVPVENVGTVIHWEDGTASDANSHWKIDFSGMAAEPGSSGAPLFDEHKRIIGQLHGGHGSKYLFGKFSYSWDKNIDPESQLKYWLDPAGASVSALDGLVKDIPPDAYFRTDITRACLYAPVTLQDLSIFNPTTWAWNINPSSFAFINSTGPDSQNPRVEFHSQGYYSITLTASNSFGSKSITRNNLIYGDSSIVEMEVIGLPQNDIFCEQQFNGKSMEIKGVPDYQVTVEGFDQRLWIAESDTKFTIHFDSTKAPMNSLVPGKIAIEGIHGSCRSYFEKEYQLFYNSYDDLQNPMPLSVGANGPFYNYCAGTEVNEPSPATSNCESKDSWCSELSFATSVLINTVWFQVLGPASGFLTISSSGMDNQMALYETESPENLLSGDPAQYKLIAYNDDISVTDFNARINHVEVKPDKLYWLQVHGKGGREGSFILDVYDHEVTIYPNPADNRVTIETGIPGLNGVNIRIFSLNGTLVYATKFLNVSEFQSINLPVNILNQGIYLFHVETNNETFTKKIVVY